MRKKNHFHEHMSSNQNPLGEVLNESIDFILYEKYVKIFFSPVEI